MDYQEDLKAAYNDLKSVSVIHNPMTPRYRRAERRLTQLCNDSKYVGHKFLESSEEVCERTYEEFVVDIYEVVFFLKSESEECGEYFVCRMLYEGDEIIEVELFCYYDGDDESICIDFLASAKKYARKKGYLVII